MVIIYSADPLFASMNLELCSIFISFWKGGRGVGWVLQWGLLGLKAGDIVAVCIRVVYRHLLGVT